MLCCGVVWCGCAQSQVSRLTGQLKSAYRQLDSAERAWEGDARAAGYQLPPNSSATSFFPSNNPNPNSNSNSTSASSSAAGSAAASANQHTPQPSPTLDAADSLHLHFKPFAGAEPASPLPGGDGGSGGAFPSFSHATSTSSSSLSASASTASTASSASSASASTACASSTSGAGYSGGGVPAPAPSPTLTLSESHVLNQRLTARLARLHHTLSVVREERAEAANEWEQERERLVRAVKLEKVEHDKTREQYVLRCAVPCCAVGWDGTRIGYGLRV